MVLLTRSVQLHWLFEIPNGNINWERLLLKFERDYLPRMPGAGDPLRSRPANATPGITFASLGDPLRSRPAITNPVLAAPGLGFVFPKGSLKQAWLTFLKHKTPPDSRWGL